MRTGENELMLPLVERTDEVFLKTVQFLRDVIDYLLDMQGVVLAPNRDDMVQMERSMESGDLHTGDMRSVADEEPLGVHRFEGVDETLVRDGHLVVLAEHRDDAFPGKV